MNLNEILKDVSIEKIVGKNDIEISDIIYDSRKAIKDCLFVSLTGTKEDGHAYINEAIKKGATAILIDKNCSGLAIDFGITNSNLTIILAKNTRKILAEISANFFRHPAKRIKTIGITGTKGKTTTTFTIKSILEAAGKKAGVIGTLGAFFENKNIKLINTTPESYEVQKYLNLMVESDCEYAIMEVASQGLKMHRVDGFKFDFGIFTNISEDHIGDLEHSDMEEYMYCKSKLFKKCKIAFVNEDDENFENIIKNHTCQIFTYGLENNPDYKAKNIELLTKNGKIGVKFDVDGKEEIKNIKIGIPGKFNIYNALAAICVCSFIGISKENILKGLEIAKVKGRVEPIATNSNFSMFIDYAHNALSMENLLTTFRDYNPKRLIVMFGAGGNRAKSRRFEVGKIAGNLADLSVITTDNPRFENPLDIIEDIKKGIKQTNGKYIVIPDRRDAIKYCIENAKDGDIIILAGKGHEDYQEIKGIRYPFDDKKVAKSIISLGIS